MPTHQDMPETAASARTAVVISRYNAAVTDQLLAGALAVLDRPAVVEAPGAFELPVIAAELARSGSVDGVLALGCVIKGETEHDRYINHSIAEGLTSIAVTTGVPMGFGVLTCSTVEQAMSRARGNADGGSDKGGESARALLSAIEQIRRIRSGSARPGSSLGLAYTPSDKSKGDH